MKSLKAKFRKTDTNEWNKNDERLLAAVEHGEVDKVTSLLAKKGTSAVKLDSEGKSALHAAAARGQTECLAAILSHGADLSITDAAGLSPLHLAAKNNHIECCKKLIQSKCSVDAIDSSGKTPLHHAAANGSVQAVQLLCELNSPINIKDADGLTPLLLSVRHGHADVCGALLDCGAEVNAADNSGRTAAMLACEAGSAAVLVSLVQHGADLSAVDSHGHDVGHYSKLSSSPELQAALAKQQVTGSRPIRSPQHDQVAKLTDERITTPKKRKAPPPPISPLQSSGPSSPSVATSTGTPGSGKSDTPKRFNYKDDELRRMAQKELQEEKNMLLNTIENLRQTVEQTGTESEKDEHGLTASSALISALQAKITALTLENQQLKYKSKPYNHNELQDSSRPNSLTSNSSFHSTQDELEVSQSHIERQTEEEDTLREKVGGKEEIQLLREALESVQVKLLESRKENRSLQAQLRPERLREEDEGVREKEREAELMESLAELQAKLTDTQERYHHALEEVQELRLLMGAGDSEEIHNVHRRVLLHEQEVKQLTAQLLQSESQKEKCLQQMKHLEEALRRAEDKHNGKEHRSTQIEELYKEAQEEIRVLQEALRGTVPVEAAAKDFEEMKGEMNEVISGLQRRLLELSHSYSETKNQLSAAQKQLSDNSASSSPTSEQGQAEVLKGRVEELEACLKEMESKYSAAQQEMSQLRLETEKQMDSSVSLTDHTQVVASLGNAIKELEKQLEPLKDQLHQKTLQLEALQNGLTSDKTSDDSVPRNEHDTMREQLKGEVSHLTQLLQGALRKQDEMALEAADAWQQARDNSAEREALQELVMSREKENQTLSTRLTESQDAVSQLKQLVENHVASEREKNKRIDDLSREVCKLKDALNSLSQLSYNSSSPSKRQQQNQQVDTMQQQIKQLQYQLAESKKQHHEIVSVYRMHLLYAVQGQMDEDVQKALKQILMMCKMPSQAKEAC